MISTSTYIHIYDISTSRGSARAPENGGLNLRGSGLKLACNPHGYY